MLPKRPRHYAAEILALDNVEDRQAALKKVPNELQSWVQELVEDADRKRKNLSKSSQKNPRIWS